MSLELQIETLNTNITALIGALAALGQAPSAAAIAAEILDTPVEVKLAPPAPEVIEEVKLAPPPVVTFDDARKAVLRLAAQDRVKAKALLAKYGAAKVSELAEGNFAAFVFAAEAELGD